MRWSRRFAPQHNSRNSELALFPAGTAFPSAVLRPDYRRHGPHSSVHVFHRVVNMRAQPDASPAARTGDVVLGVQPIEQISAVRVGYREDHDSGTELRAGGRGERHPGDPLPEPFHDRRR